MYMASSRECYPPLLSRTTLIANWPKSPTAQLQTACGQRKTVIDEVEQLPNTIPFPPASVMFPRTPFAPFEFPKTIKSAGRIERKEVNMRQLRIELNGKAGHPWYTPLYSAEMTTIRKSESKVGVTFVPGTGIVVYDGGHEGVL